MRKLLRTLTSLTAAVLAGLFLTQCASGYAARASKVARVYVLPSERMLLRVQPFDSTLVAELSRGGLNPIQVEEDFNAELRYRFSLRHQELALDSVGAQVILTVALQHLQPGTGNTGTFGRLSVSTHRGDSTERATSEWRELAKANIDPVYLARHTVRTTVEQVVEKVRSVRTKPREPAPPLILLH